MTAIWTTEKETTIIIYAYITAYDWKMGKINLANSSKDRRQRVPVQEILWKYTKSYL